MQNKRDNKTFWIWFNLITEIVALIVCGVMIEREQYGFALFELVLACMSLLGYTAILITKIEQSR